MLFRLSLHESLSRRMHEQSPSAFRRAVRISADHEEPFAQLEQPWQQADFAALDQAWLSLAGRSAAQPLWRAYIERPRGHAKTSDMALQIVWALLFSPRSLHGLAAAADREQASLIRSSVHRIGQLNPRICRDLEFRQHLVVNPHTGSRLEIISSDVQSSWGALPDFVICDELCHWEKPELWHSLFSSAAKRPRCLLAVLTNAGVGRGWQWEVREAARHSPGWYFSSLAGSQAPWITPENLAEQQRLLPATVFARLWNNQWQEGGGEFVTLQEAEACREESLRCVSHGDPGRSYIAAVDYAEKHDYTVGVIVHGEGDRVVVDRLDVIRPTADAPVKVSWVEQWIAQAARNFQNIRFVLDEYQLLGTIQRLEERYDIRRFAFQSGGGNHALAMNLRKLIVHREVRWYPQCGSLNVPWGRDDLETELASLILKQNAAGRVRFDHLRDAIHHDDRSFALGAACLHALQDAAPPDWLHISEPLQPGEFGW